MSLSRDQDAQPAAVPAAEGPRPQRVYEGAALERRKEWGRKWGEVGKQAGKIARGEA